MKLTFCPDNGYMLADLKSKLWLGRLTRGDAGDLMLGNGRMTYDRRRSWLKISDREWADGVQW